MRNKFSLEYVAKWYPVEKAQQRLQSDIDETCVLRVRHYKRTQLKDLLKLVAHALF